MALGEERWHDIRMAMREECKHFQSRTYDSGEVARYCELDLAPEAPWKCPENCPSFAPRLADVGWVHGSLVEPALENEPNLPGDEIARILDSAEDIVNEIAPEVLAEVRASEEAREKKQGKKWWRFGRS
jgi:hypothetical protein